jgi:hypothetical protein
MYCRCTVNGTCGSGGGTRVINLGAAVGAGVALGTLSDTGAVLETSGEGRTASGTPRPAVTAGRGLTGGGFTGLPGSAARKVGFTFG